MTWVSDPKHFCSATPGHCTKGHGALRQRHAQGIARVSTVAAADSVARGAPPRTAGRSEDAQRQRYVGKCNARGAPKEAPEGAARRLGGRALGRRRHGLLGTQRITRCGGARSPRGPWRPPRGYHGHGGGRGDRHQHLGNIKYAIELNKDTGVQKLPLRGAIGMGAAGGTQAAPRKPLTDSLGWSAGSRVLLKRS